MANNRMLKNTTLSKKVEKLSMSAEVLFYRLIMVVDDWGSFFADHKVVKSSCFPLKDTLRSSDVALWIEELVKAGLIVVYTEADTSYLNILNFGQRLRNKRSKFPEPPIAEESESSDPQTIVSNSQQFAADGSNLSLKLERKLEEKYEGNEVSATFSFDEEFSTGKGHQPFAVSNSLQLPQKTREAVEMNQFTFTNQKNTDFVSAHWNLFIAEAMNNTGKRYTTLQDFTSHFINWMRNKFPKNEKGNEQSKTDAKTSAQEQQSRKLLGLQ